ncbi:SHOCT domain-containing protein [Halosolutus gelatinilyticus]|uniref:SHOCT domain-containing protein n=1 Tax=Halosolutus gelatinilyticus TaxID=2931975 RepID=UPI001FF69ADD|nr:SHOCT domain-containing protein [Halosolutus gelatinilyticus]
MDRDSRRFDRPARLGRWHALVERYTPDGWLGRTLLGSTTGMSGLWLLALALFEVPRWGLSLAALFWLPALLGLGLPALALSLAVLWPVYLSLIGNIESADAYPRSRTDERAIPSGRESESPKRRDSAASAAEVDTPEPAASDPFGDLKRQYANGELSEDEFERRIELRLQDGTARSTAGDTGGAGVERRERVPDRN